MIANERPERGQAIVYDPERIAHIAPEQFVAQSWPVVQAVSRDRGGRGGAYFVGETAPNLVLRHYCRGGLPGRLVRDHYWYLGERLTRSFREWHLLHRLADMGLPVPRPVAARYVRSGLFYTADLITERLMNVRSLANLVTDTDDVDDRLRQVGATVRKFHDAGLWHADLNAHNIQLDTDRVWLIDFDRSRLHPRPVAGASNLARLERSLRKIAQTAGQSLDERIGRAIRSGYSRPASGVA
ncbi:MAG: 3-deoxy-D-manno-octulosonic acid kinase [Pseudomonadota bacterium]